MDNTTSCGQGLVEEGRETRSHTAGEDIAREARSMPCTLLARLKRAEVLEQFWRDLAFDRAPVEL